MRAKIKHVIDGIRYAIRAAKEFEEMLIEVGLIFGNSKEQDISIKKRSKEA